MIYLLRRHAIYQLLTACLMCTSLAGQTQLMNKTSTRLLSKMSNNLTNVSTTSTTISKDWYQLKEEFKENVNIAAMSMAALGVVLNIAVILAITLDPLKVLRKGPWATILSLATADLITCISGFFLWSHRVIFHEPTELHFKLVDFGWAFGFSASFLMLTFLTAQTFIVTNFPMKSRYWLTTMRVKIFGMGFWLFALPLGLSNIARLYFSARTSLKFYVAHIGVLEFATIVQVVLHFQVAVKIVKSGRHISENVEITKHKKIAKTVIILTLILFFTALPYFIFKQLEYLARLEYFGQSKTGKILFALSYCYSPIAVLNFVANPVLYSLRLPDYRATLFALVGKRKSSRKGIIAHAMTKSANEFLMRSRKLCETSGSQKLVASKH